MANHKYQKLKIILRDGIETINRDFDFNKTIIVKVGQGEIHIAIKIPKNDSARLLLLNHGVGKRTIKDVILPGVEKFCEYETIGEDKYKICPP